MDKGVREFAKLFDEQKEKVLVDATTRVSGSLVKLSPVGEDAGGEFVAGWEFQINGTPADTIRPNDPKKTQTRKRLKAEIQRMKWGDYAVFQNSDPVGPRLEFGYSKKAPQGMVRLTARRWRRFVKGAGTAAQNRIKKTFTS